MARPGRLPYAVVDLVAEIKRARPDADDVDIEPEITIVLDAISFFAALREANHHSSGRTPMIEVEGATEFKMAGVTFRIA
jgi:hypothetical protein